MANQPTIDANHALAIRLAVLETQRDMIVDRIDNLDTLSAAGRNIELQVTRNNERITTLEAKTTVLDAFQGRLLWLVLVGLAGQVLRIIGSGNLADLIQK